MVGIDPASDGLARAARLSVPSTHEGIEGLRGLPNYAHVGVVFDATSAGAHIRNNEILQRDGKKVIDLTPAAIGPFTIPVINGDANLDEPNVNMVTCGGQATIPMVYAVRRATKRGAQAAQPPSRRTCVASGRNCRILRRRSRPRQYGACRLQRERRRGELAVAGDRNGRDARLCVERDRGPLIFGVVASVSSLRAAFPMLLPVSLAILALACVQRRRLSSDHGSS